MPRGQYERKPKEKSMMEKPEVVGEIEKKLKEISTTEPVPTSGVPAKENDTNENTDETTIQPDPDGNIDDDEDEEDDEEYGVLNCNVSHMGNHYEKGTKIYKSDPIFPNLTPYYE